MIDKICWVIAREPLFSAVSHFPIESQVYDIIILIVLVLEFNLMFHYSRKVFFGLLCGGGTQPFVVLDFVTFKIATMSPLLILGNSKERLYVIPFCHLQNGRHKLF